jgi:hypothetical protein
MKAMIAAFAAAALTIGAGGAAFAKPHDVTQKAPRLRVQKKAAPTNGSKTDFKNLIDTLDKLKVHRVAFERLGR